MTLLRPQPDLMVDVSLETCPMTFVHVRLALDQLQAGQVLEVRLSGAEPRRNIPLTAQEQGHEVHAWGVARDFLEAISRTSR